MSLLDTLQRTLSDHPTMLPLGERVLVAVSGGPDSLSLLHALFTLRDTCQLAWVGVAHLDHGLRGEESAAEAAFVADYCSQLGLPCELGLADVAALQKRLRVSKQQAARTARYEFLQNAANRVGATKIATAHTQDDRIETVLLNILRGTGTDGLRGIPYSNNTIIRPLLDVTRAEVESYCREQNLAPRRDPSNFQTENYTRNRIRLDLLPRLEHDYNANVRNALLRLSEISSRDAEYLNIQARTTLLEITETSDTGYLTLNRAQFASMHPALQRYTLRAAIAQVRVTTNGVTFEHLEAVCTAIAQTSPTPPFALTLPEPACSIRVDTSHITISQIVPEHAIPNAILLPLTIPDSIRFGETPWQIATSHEPFVLADDLQHYLATLDADTIDLPSLHARTWIVGDRMTPLGLSGHSKKLQDIWTNAKVPKSERHTTPLICDKNGIIWIPSIAVSERAKTTLQTSQYLYLMAKK